MKFSFPFLFRLTIPILDSLQKTNYAPPEGTTVSTKTILCSLIQTTPENQAAVVDRDLVLSSIKNSTLALALLISSQTSTHESLCWIPKHISLAAASAFYTISEEYYAVFGKSLVAELLPEVAPFLKERIKESSIDKKNNIDEVTAASARVPVVHAILAAYQLRWFVTQV